MDDRRQLVFDLCAACDRWTDFDRHGCGDAGQICPKGAALHLRRRFHRIWRPDAADGILTGDHVPGRSFCRLVAVPADGVCCSGRPADLFGYLPSRKGYDGEKDILVMKKIQTMIILRHHIKLLLKKLMKTLMNG